MNKKTLKKIITIILIICFCLCFCGCWDYVSLNEIAIVTAIAIDKVDGKYKLTYEVVDLIKSNKDTGVVPAYIESEERTLFETVRQAKSRSANKLFFGNIECLVLSEKIAIEEGLYTTLDLFLRDAEPRETIHVLISQEETAEKILREGKGLTNPLHALEITQIIAEDHDVTSETGDVKLYQVYQVLFAPGREVVMPAFHLAKNNDEITSEANGVALFKEDRLMGYLTPEETFSYLFVIDEVSGGTFPVMVKEEDHEYMVTFEINKSKTKKDFEYDEQKDAFKMTVEIDCDVFLAECTLMHDMYDHAQIEKIEKQAGNDIKMQIESVVKKVQTEYDSDIFGFGNLVYRKKAKLWDKVSKNWDKYFKELDVEVKPNIHIRNTASFRS